MDEQPGFTIEDRFYPFPTSFRLGDPVLVAETTGLAWNEFAELLDAGDPRTLAGLVAVAVWQQNPGWRREKVLRYVEALDLASIEFPEAADDAVGDEKEEEVANPSVSGSDTTEPSPVPSTLISDGLAASGSHPSPIGSRPSPISFPSGYET